MLLKWIFTILAAIWLFRLLSQWLQPQHPPPPPPPPPEPPPKPTGTVDIQPRRPADDSDYIDYEELK